MEILQSIALLAISFVAIFWSMEILWRLSGKQAVELNQQERMQEPQKMSLPTEI